MTEKTKVFICHFHNECRRQLRFVLSTGHLPLKVIGECSEYPECIEWLENNAVDQVIVAFPSYVVNSDHVLEDLQSYFPKVKFIEFTDDLVEELKRVYSILYPLGHKLQTDLSTLN